jgi:hypothetical protein
VPAADSAAARRPGRLDRWLERAVARAPLLERLPWVARRQAARFSRRDVLSAVPFRNPLIEWELREPADGAGGAPEMVLRVPRRQDGWRRLLNRLFEGPPYRQVVLDELGTDVWRMCDGETSVEALIRSLANRHKLERREVELSLTIYLQTLAKRGFIGLRLEGDGPGPEGAE